MQEVIKLIKGLKLELNNNKEIVFSYMSYFDNPIFLLKDTKTRVTIVDNRVYSVTGDDEPNCPAKEEYQAKILNTHKYNFFKGCFEKKGNK